MYTSALITDNTKLIDLNKSDDKIIPRKQINQLIEDKRIVIVEGKPGQGKTVLIREYLRSLEATYFWYSIIERSVNIRNLLDSIIASLNSRTPGQQIDNAETFFTNYDKPGIIVIDKFERLTLNDQEGEIFGRILQHAAAEIRFILISSKKISFVLTTFIDRKDIRVIDDETLALTRKDVDNLIACYPSAHFSAKSIKMISDFSDGWITALIYFLEKYSEQKFKLQIKPQSVIFDLLKGELNLYFEKKLNEFLTAKELHMLVSIGCLREIEEDLLKDILDNDGLALLQKLERNYFFVKKEKRNNTFLYIFHRVMHMHLYGKFSELNDVQKEKALNKIIKYHDRKNNYNSLIKYLIMNGELKKAKSVFCEYGETLLDKENYNRIKKLLKDFELEEHKSDPVIRYFRNMISIYGHPHSSTSELLELIPYFLKRKQYNKVYSICIALLASSFYYQQDKEDTFEIVKQAEDFLNSEVDLPNQKIDILKALLSLGKWWVAKETEDSIKIALEAEEAAINVNNTEALIYAQLVLAKSYLSRGLFLPAENLLETMYEQKSTGTKSNILKSIISFYLGDVYFYQGKLLQAVHIVNESLNLNEKYSDFNYFLLINIAFYYLYMSDIGNVRSVLNKLDDKFSRDHNHYAQYAYYSVKMLYAYRTKNKSRVQYYLNKLSSGENVNLLETYYPSCYLDLIEINIYLENYDVAMKISLQLIEELNDRLYPYTLATTYAFLGYMNHKSGDGEISKSWFDRMEKGIKDIGFTNLYIVSPELLSEIVQLSQKSCFENFYRIDLNKNNINAYNNKLNVKTFGGFNCISNGTELDTLTILRQKKIRDLFFLLLTYRDIGVQKSVIYDLFWPHYNIESARDNLNTTLYRLRKIIDPDNKIIISDPDSLKLDQDNIITDVDLFLSSLKKAKAAEHEKNFSVSLKAYEKALLYYEGHFLNECDDLDRVILEREFLSTKQRQTIFNISKIYLKNRALEKAHENLTVLIKQSPLCEPAYRLLMICQALAGNRGEVLTIYKNIKTLLENELDLDVDKRTDELKESLLGSYGNIDYEIEKEILL